jgi:hypothetical protein
MRFLTGTRDAGRKSRRGQGHAHRALAGQVPGDEDMLDAVGLAQLAGLAPHGLVAFRPEADATRTPVPRVLEAQRVVQPQLLAGSRRRLGRHRGAQLPAISADRRTGLSEPDRGRR